MIGTTGWTGRYAFGQNPALRSCRVCPASPVMISRSARRRHPGPRHLDQLGVAALRACLEVNVVGTWLACRAAAAPMRSAGYGRILTMASALGLVGGAARSGYPPARARLSSSPAAWPSRSRSAGGPSSPAPPCCSPIPPPATSPASSCPSTAAGPPTEPPTRAATASGRFPGAEPLEGGSGESRARSCR
jgi:hypothetical protein